MRIDQIVMHVTERLSCVPGVMAVVLGGSRAAGTADERSDIDIGIYYDGNNTLDIAALRDAARDLDAGGDLTEPGEWGPWINGGGWLHIDGVPTDLLLRDLTKVRSVINECVRGHITIDYQCGHPFGFVNAIYAAEITSCKIQYEMGGVLSALKQKLVPYPPQMRQAMISKFLWEAEFSHHCGEKSVSKGDFVNAAGSIYRCIVCLLQVLAAHNNLFLMNEKGALTRVLASERKPHNLSVLCETAFAGLTSDPSALYRSFEATNTLITEVKSLI